MAFNNACFYFLSAPKKSPHATEYKTDLIVGELRIVHILGFALANDNYHERNFALPCTNVS